MRGQIECFLDANILLYLISNDPKEAHKQQAAAQLINSEVVGLSTQVLQEFYVNAIKSKKPTLTPALSPALAAEFVARLRAFPMTELDGDDIQAAITLSQSQQLSYWDSAIIVAAQKMGAKTLYSEDLQHGQKFGKCKIVNPFIKA